MNSLIAIALLPIATLASVTAQATDTPGSSSRSCAEQAGNTKGTQRKEIMLKCEGLNDSAQEKTVKRQPNHPFADERVVLAMARETGYAEAQIRDEVQKGCDGSQGDMAICAWYQHYKADLALNETYRALIQRLEAESATKELRAAQRAWIAYRDAECRFSTQTWEGGSFRQVATAVCREGMTKQRLSVLQEYLACEGEECHTLRETPSRTAR